MVDDPMPFRARCENPRASLQGHRQAFTLVELLVSMALLIIIIGVVAQITNQTSKVWLSSTSRIQTFQEARAGFESMTRKLGQATLNTYYDYYDAGKISRSLVSSANLASFVPSTYDRYSELHFISGQVQTFALQTSATNTKPITTQTHAVFFQAALGYSVNYQELDNALNACGYFLQFDDAAASIPPHVKASPGYKQRWRFRLMEMTQPTEQLGIYDPAVAAAIPAHSKDCLWFVANAAANSRVIAENVIALVMLPKMPPSQDDPANATGHGVSLAPNYNYNSRIPLGAVTDATTNPTLTGFPGDAFIAYPTCGAPINATRHAQLPPIMQVVMIVIDEPSAARLQGNSTTPPAAIDLTKTSLFTNAANMAADIQAVEDICNAKSGNLTSNTLRLTYRIFNSEIGIRDAKWSNN